MADINTTLRGNNEEKEDPKSPNVIAKKIIQGLIFIILVLSYNFIKQKFNLNYIFNLLFIIA